MKTSSLSAPSFFLFVAVLCSASQAVIAQTNSKSTHVGTLGDDDGLSRPDYFRYKNRAFPMEDIDTAQSEAARKAFKSISAGAAIASKNWVLAAPVNNPVPGEVTYTGRATTVSGRTTALALTPGCAINSQGDCKAFLGAAGGGVWLAEDPFAGKVEWKPISNGLDSNAIGSLAVDPKKRGLVIYAGTGEPNASADSEAGVGLYKSVDGGKSWAVVPASVPLANGLAIASIAIDPRDSKHLYFGTATALHGAAATADPYLPPNTANLGVYESRDGGATFVRVLNTAPGNAFYGGIMQIELDPNDADTVYASILGVGLARSSATLDGNSAWRLVFATGEPNDGFNRLAFAVTKLGNATRVYVGDAIDYYGTSSLYRVDNARVPAALLSDGSSNPGWLALSDPTPGTPGYGSFGFCQGQCWYDIFVATPPGEPDTVWIGGSMNYDEIFTATPPSNGRAVMRSTNAGVSFSDMTNDARDTPLGMHPDQHAIIFNPKQPGQALVASDGGVVRTSGDFTNTSSQCAGRGLIGADLDDCLIWLSSIPSLIEPVNDGLATLQFGSVAVDPNHPGDVWMGGTQDNGTWAFGEPSTPFFETINGDGGSSGFDAVNSNVRFHTYYGPSVDVNFQGATTVGWNWTADPLYASGEASAFYPPVIADPVASGSIFAGLQHVWRTQDSGGPQDYLEQHCNEFFGDFTVSCGDWVPLGADLTKSGFGATRTGGNVALIARSTGDKGTLWAATNRGRVFMSSNASVANASTVRFVRLDSATTPRRVISGIAVDPNNGRHGWVAYTGYGFYTPEAPGHVFEVSVSAAGSAAFKDISYNLGDLPVTALVRDERSGDLYIGTDFGVLVLEAGASQWVVAGKGLPPVAIYQLALPPSGPVYAATHGRSMWRLETE